MSDMSVQDIHIRKLTDSGNDLRVLTSLLTCMSGVFTPPLEHVVDIDAYAQKLLSFGAVIVSEIAGEFAGLVGFYANDERSRCAFLSLLGVSPEYQGGGVGIMLAKAACTESRKMGMEKMRLEVYSHNLKAIKLYKKLGFYPIDPYKKSSYADSIFLEADIREKA